MAFHLVKLSVKPARVAQLVKQIIWHHVFFWVHFGKTTGGDTFVPKLVGGVEIRAQKKSGAHFGCEFCLGFAGHLPDGFLKTHLFNEICMVKSCFRDLT